MANEKISEDRAAKSAFFEELLKTSPKIKHTLIWRYRNHDAIFNERGEVFIGNLNAKKIPVEIHEELKHMQGLKEYYEKEYGIKKFTIHSKSRVYEERGTYYGVRMQRWVNYQSF